MRTAPVWLVAMVSVFAITTGCTTDRVGGQASVASTVAAPAATDTADTTDATDATDATDTAEMSAFCLDLTTFQVGVIVFRADAGKAIDGQPLDFDDLRTKAARIAFVGAEMKSSAPPDIRDQFQAVLAAVATSAGRMKPGVKVIDIVDPLFGKATRTAFDAVDKYECK